MKTTIGLATGVTWLCWAIAASEFFATTLIGNEPIGGPWALVIAFVLNSFRLDQAPAILVNSWQHQRWLFVAWGVLLATSTGFGMYLWRVERELSWLRR